MCWEALFPIFRVMTLDASNQKRIKEALECVKRAEEQ